MSFAVDILTAAIASYPDTLIKDAWTWDDGPKCSGEHVHTQIVQFGQCSCNDEDEIKQDCIATALGLMYPTVTALIDLNDNALDGERSAMTLNMIVGWLSIARKREEEEQKGLPSFDVLSQADAIIADAADQTEPKIKTPVEDPEFAGVT